MTVERVFEELRAWIFAARFAPGEALRELHLARELGVSQATVREALVRLAGLGLVVREKNRRTTVTSFEADEIRDRLEMRLALEPMAGERAAARVTAEDVRALRGLAVRMEEAAARGDHFAHVEADIGFHEFIWARCGSAVLEATLRALATPLFAYLSVVHSAEGRDMRRSRSHRKIVAALAAGDGGRVRAELEAHIRKSYFSGKRGA